CMEAMARAAEHLCLELDRALGQPSGNPLFLDGTPPMHRPSGSFLNPALTIATGGMIEALLMAGWGSVQRLTHVLSGAHGGVAVDAATAGNPIGLIQWPKNAQAKLEAMRRVGGVRSFVSGGSTSY